MRRNPELIVGLCLLGTLLVFVAIGHLFVDLDKARPLSNRPLQPPSLGLPFGTDKQGRNLLAVMVVGTPLTIEIGIGAGLIGVGFGNPAGADIGVLPRQGRRYHSRRCRRRPDHPRADGAHHPGTRPFQ